MTRALVLADPTEAVRALLPRTYYPFLGRFGRVREVQARAIPPILEGRDVVVSAPTASGKTEAVAAPLVARHLAGGRVGAPAIVYVSPTRALANDLARRLEVPLASLTVSFVRRTGDHPAFPRNPPPEIVVTTPESLDSLLARGPARFRGVHALVADEVHILDGTARGEQLRCLIARLRRLGSGEPLQVVALSATLDDLPGIARRYLVDGLVVRTGGGRPVEATLEPLEELSGLREQVPWIHRQFDAQKLLVFVDRRADAEETGALLQGVPPFAGKVLVHHGSLSRQVRERTEKRFLESPVALCVATLTLELGIDIGDVDLVVLLSPPRSVTSLLQRVGRGNRRRSTTRVLCYHGGPADRLRYEVLFGLAAEGRLAEPPPPIHPGVLVQQSFSLLFQNPGRFLTREALHARIPSDLAERYSLLRIEELLRTLRSREYLEGSSNHYIPSEKLLRMFERGQIHANIASDATELEVVEEATGRTVGTISRGAAQHTGQPFVLGGRNRRTVRQDDRRIYVESGPAAPAPVFKSRGIPITSFPLAQALRERMGLPEGVLPLLRRGLPENHVLVFHFLGSLMAELYAAVLTGHGRAKVKRTGPYSIRLERPPRDRGYARQLTPGEVSDLVWGRARRLGHILGQGPFTDDLPDGWLEEAVEQAIPVDLFRRLVQNLTPVDDPDPEELRQALHDLARSG
jgi:ATP-dependent Lhr-like helicase